MIIVDDDMAPQPLSRVRNVNDLKLGIDAMRHASPELLSLVTRAVSGWSRIEVELNCMFGAVLTADFVAVAEMVSALYGSQQRKAVLDAAAMLLKPKDKTLYDEVMSAIKPVEDQRNKFAHHVWASSASVPDALMLIEPKELVRVDARVSVMTTQTREWLEDRQQHPNAWTPPPEGLLAPEATISHDLVMVYRKPDLDRQLLWTGWAYHMVAMLQQILWTQDAEPRHFLRLFLDSPPKGLTLSKNKTRSTRP